MAASSVSSLQRPQAPSSQHSQFGFWINVKRCVHSSPSPHTPIRGDFLSPSTSTHLNFLFQNQSRGCCLLILPQLRRGNMLSLLWTLVLNPPLFPLSVKVCVVCVCMCVTQMSEASAAVAIVCCLPWPCLANKLGVSCWNKWRKTFVYCLLMP